MLTNTSKNCVALRGITWDDPRGYGPLSEIDNAFPGNVKVQWDIQPLEGFESRSVVELARQYDILNIDHPHVGEAVSENALHPVGNIEDTFLGLSLASYTLNGEVWAVPVDAACMVSAYSDRAIDKPPHSYPEVFALAKSARIAMPLAGVHSLMALLTLLAQYKSPLSDDIDGSWPSPDAFERVVRELKSLTECCLPESLDWNPLQAFEALHSGLCDYTPLTFAYASACRGTVNFRPVPSLNDLASFGAVLGGTGLAVSAYCEHLDAALRYTRFVGSQAAQVEIWAENEGQPACRAAWLALSETDPFYRDLLPAVERARIRPRYRGWNRRQTEAGNAINCWLRRGNTDSNTLREELQYIWLTT